MRFEALIIPLITFKLVFDFPTFIVVAFTVPILSVEMLLSIELKFPLDELRLDTLSEEFILDSVLHGINVVVEFL